MQILLCRTCLSLAVLAAWAATLGADDASRSADGSSAAAHSETVFTLDPARTFQEWEGFGVSGCWWSQEVGGWAEPTRRRLLTWLFDPVSGIGLTTYRHNLGAGSLVDATIHDPLRRADCQADGIGSYDWTRDAHSVRILREAVAAGAKRVILFANSPPVFLTRNGRAYGDPRPKKSPASNLASERFEAFASHLAACARHFLEVEGMPVVAVSPVNEPEWGWNEPKQEGCHYSPDEAASMLRATLAVFAREGLGHLRIEGPEGGSWRTARPYFDAIAASPDLRERITHLAVHSYFSTTHDKETTRLHLDRLLPHATLHMTEWTQFKGKRDYGMTSALELARIVMEDVALGRCASWQYWIAASPYNYHDGLVHLDKSAQTLALTKRLWALGQFSRFVRPGWKLLGRPELRGSGRTGAAEAPGMLAAVSPDGARCAVVFSNPEERPVSVRIAWSDGRAWTADAFHVTDGDRDIAAAPLGSEGASIALPPRSVSTATFRRRLGGPRRRPPRFGSVRPAAGRCSKA